MLYILVEREKGRERESLRERGFFFLQLHTVSLNEWSSGRHIQNSVLGSGDELTVSLQTLQSAKANTPNIPELLGS